VGFGSGKFWIDLLNEAAELNGEKRGLKCYGLSIICCDSKEKDKKYKRGHN
jgi:hypothetical protein